MLEARVENFFDNIQLGAPHVLHLVKAAVDVVEAPIYISKTGVHVGAEFSKACIHIAQAGVVSTARTVGTEARAIVTIWVSVIPT